jgi:SAM-dependent methyltransferase
MNFAALNAGTDAAWEEWGRRDPYFGVLTDPKFRRNAMTTAARSEFFRSGEVHVDYVMAMVQQYINADFSPRSVLDFGCGVGRTLIPLARIARNAVGLDVSRSMLREARRNCDQHGLPNVRLVLSNHLVSSTLGSFDFVHSFIVFQHIPPARGRETLRRLLQHLAPGGVAALQFCYSKQHLAGTHGVAPVIDQPRGDPTEVRPLPPAGADPEMQMNAYNVNELLFLIQNLGVSRFHVDFTDHGGELGIFLFFQMNRSST